MYFEYKFLYNITMQEIIDRLTFRLQSSHHTLLKRRNNLNSFIEALHEYQDRPGSSSYGRKLGTE